MVLPTHNICTYTHPILLSFSSTIQYPYLQFLWQLFPLPYQVGVVCEIIEEMLHHPQLHLSPPRGLTVLHI